MKWTDAERCLKQLEGRYHRLSRLSKAVEAELAEPEDREGLGEAFLSAALLVLERAATQRRDILEEMQAIEDAMADD
jgi:hypothetical protein